MKAPLAIRFDKDAIEAKCAQLAGGTGLTKADIGRAAMNRGLQILDKAKGGFSGKGFESFVIESQEAQK